MCWEVCVSVEIIKDKVVFLGLWGEGGLEVGLFLMKIG